MELIPYFERDTVLPQRIKYALGRYGLLHDPIYHTIFDATSKRQQQPKQSILEASSSTFWSVVSLYLDLAEREATTFERLSLGYERFGYPSKKVYDDYQDRQRSYYRDASMAYNAFKGGSPDALAFVKAGVPIPAATYARSPPG